MELFYFVVIFINMKDKLIPKSNFHIIVGITALMIALCAAAFSVYGISTLFAGAAISVAVMAGTLEIGKLIATTFIYRYWTKIGLLLKTYLTSAVVILMLITSLGIFGFLSSAYQKSSLEYDLTQSRIVMVEDQKAYHYDAITNAVSRVSILNEVRKTQENRLSSAQTNVFLTRNPIQLQQLQAQTTEAIETANTEIRGKNEEIKTERLEIQKLDEQIAALKIGSAEKKDIQTLKYVADQLKWELDDVAFWFMLAIIFVFDPLAIALILAYNVMVFKKESIEVEEIPVTIESTEKKLIFDAGPSEKKI